MLDEKYLKSEEKIIFALRSLYSKYGYLPYKMSKFEEYDLYAKNKEFLVSDSVITFTDTNGKLLALKPDVTLSIIKNATEARGVKQKVYYSENVYRISGSTRQYKEIMQTGLECIGDIDLYDVCEAVSLSAKSLGAISKDYVLEISHMGILSAILEKIGGNEGFCQEVTECIKKKSRHEILECCEKYGIDKEGTDLLCEFVTVYGCPKSVFERLDKMGIGALTDAIEELKALCSLLEGKANIRLDFSIVNDMNYYNGIVFNGFIKGVCECVLFGGRYDKLLAKMGKSGGGVGFAIYTDLLNGLNKETKGYDVDVLLIYKDTTPYKKVEDAVEWLVSQGKTVSAQKSIPDKLRYKELKEMED
ncbi:MAG: ATP phosphoribosyltransferase regulatory subunit [Clostridia bacterium]|nr:ATP phosphoribosyltransferase regulatory subunit [Clostridia bacterium]MBQ7907836.1 ATP phosphoribosyltransferase regulatory subunit [Clostridia bacterium]